MATYTSFMEAIADELSEFKEKQAEGVAREGARYSPRLTNQNIFDALA